MAPLLTTLTDVCARSAAPPAPPAAAGVLLQIPPLPPLPPRPTMLPLLTICSELPDGKTPVSKAGRVVELELIVTPLAIVTVQEPGTPALAAPIDSK
jgi:hypothetical protein